MPVAMGATLLRRFNPPAGTLRTIENIERSAKRGADLVRQILSFARGAATWSSAIALGDIAAELQTIIRSTFPKNIAFALDVADDLLPVSGDTTQIVQVLLNLAVNARDAMPNGGRLRFSATNVSLSGERYVLLEMADDGTGMSPDVIQRIFDPFYTTKPVGKGTGLGLFTVQDIVRRHGGRIEVASQPGKGTRFSIHLPASARPAAPVPPEPVVDDIPRGNGELIMIVDDEASILAVMQQTLESFGYAVLTAADGAHAVALYASRSARVAAVVTDMMMGVVDGGALIASLLGMNAALPIIATSGDSTDDWPSRARAAGARHILPKPYTAPLLLRMLAEIVRPQR
jgi:CheY-like chemotaxis protein/two-component sensor histidine kinase